MSFRPCALIPSHNHYVALPGIVARLRDAGLPVIVVDDGSGEPARSAIAAVHAPGDGITVVRLPTNRGKGGAVIEGFRLATAAGFSHAIQIDADGQHDLAALPCLLERARKWPEALVAGGRIYDASAPRSRRIGRLLTDFWIFIETLSFRATDAMCGFRAYPLAAVNELLAREKLGLGMEFDIEIMVRLFWRGAPIVMSPVGVVYPPGNISNFAMVRDNWRITKAHTRLVLTMLIRLPSILRNRPPRLAGEPHWSNMAERGAYWGLRALAALYRMAGERVCMAAIAPVALYFHFSSRSRRRASHEYLERVFRARGDDRRPGWRDGVHHALDFARKAIETFAAWTGGRSAAQVSIADPAALEEAARAPSGILLFVSHLGNVELSRALLEDERRSRIVPLVHTRHAENYNRVIQRFRPDAALNVIQVSEINPETGIQLRQRIEDGAWIAIAGDRTPIKGERTSRAPFLGSEAPFPEGPYLLAHLLGCPVYLMFCLREGGAHRIYFEKFAERIELPRRDRETALRTWVEAYSRRLEAMCLRAPWQWYNFFDFWAR